MVGVKNFRYWCQKVLPLTYDDSLSYYELLNKVVGVVNDAVADIKELGYNFEELKELFEKLKKYVNEYFDNLDVQIEINKKLDIMASDGTLDNIINKNIFKELNDKVDKHISDTDNKFTNIENQFMLKENYSETACFGLFFNILGEGSYAKSTFWKSGNGKDFYPLIDLPIKGRNTVLGYFEKTDTYLRCDYSDIFDSKGITIGTSKNLIDWKIHTFNPGITIPTTGPSKHLWSNPGSFFEYKGKYYLCFYCNTDIGVNVGDTGSSFSTYVMELTYCDITKVEYKAPIKIVGISENYYIDPYIYVNEECDIYKIFYKKDLTPWAIYVSDIDLDTMKLSNTVELTKLGHTVEALSAFYTGKEWYVYVDDAHGMYQDGGGMIVYTGESLDKLQGPYICACNGMNMRAGGVVRFRDMKKSVKILSQFTKTSYHRLVSMENMGTTLKLLPGNNTSYLSLGNIVVNKIEGSKTNYAEVVTGVNGCTVFTDNAILMDTNSVCFNDADDTILLVKVNENDWHIIGEPTKSLVKVSPDEKIVFNVFGKVVDPIVLDIFIALNSAEYYCFGKLIIMDHNKTFNFVKEAEIKQTNANIYVECKKARFKNVVDCYQVTIHTNIPYSSYNIKCYGQYSIGLN